MQTEDSYNMLKLTQRILSHAIMGIALLTLFSCKNTANNSAPLTAVFILAGQSNMAGEAWVDEAPADYYPLPTNVELYDFTQKFDYKAHAAWRETHEPRDAAEFVSTRPSGQFGPELGFAATISDAYPNRKFIFIKWAMGGSSQQEWSPQWDVNNFTPNSVEAIRGALFQQAVHAIKSVDLQNEPHEFAGLLWFQGEKDSKSFTAASAYEENMKTLITAFRDELDTPEMPIFIGKVNPLTERHTRPTLSLYLRTDFQSSLIMCIMMQQA